MKASRREFCPAQVTAAIPISSGFMPFGVAAAPKKSGAAPRYKSVKRIGQTKLDERDPAVGDVEVSTKYWASADVQALALNVSGPLPDRSPFFHISSDLNGRDLSNECLTAAKKRGIRVIVGITPDIQHVSTELLATTRNGFAGTAKAIFNR